MASKEGSGTMYRMLTWLLFHGLSRRPLLRLLKRLADSSLASNRNNKFSNKSPRIRQEKSLMVASILNSIDASIAKGNLKKQVVGQVLSLWGASLASPVKNSPRIKEFHDRNGCYPPWLLVISPGHFCNLRCRDCYASSGKTGSRIEWTILDRFIKDAREKWGIRLVVFSGGEPFAYRSRGKGIMDIARKNPDLLFLAFTNGTLIDDQTVDDLCNCKNLTPAFSVEGFREITDSRRGKGVFDRVLGSMKLVRDAGLPFGISVTVNKDNCTRVLEDGFLEFFFKQQGAFYGFYFQYLPIGRNADFSLMPTASQRKDFYKKIWEQIEKEKYFLIDFWNHGTLVNGCIAAGREGGYFYVDWNGKVMPCVFAPYSAGNIHDIYRDDKLTLEDLWGHPFFKAIRSWQKDLGYGQKEAASGGNLLMPCPYRDHHKKFMEWVRKFDIEPEDASARKLLADPAISKKMIEYDRQLAGIFDPVWKKNYLG
jgi:MoaA/NifB/PqqE/SkfB family radical SAM enzyme